ncbi:3-deoxy-D-manno-octulosonic acid transferase [Algoriphagus vanfongensis]|uniref:3-deoxy-D-manno-octulosonic acid transferase n=1 Tax=Algoriphagus vanfongensis TaxID=426371 RepID=UPI00040B50A5|nr:glycosyltransferase N-terminal domain-containing protein [Algoriphagus vanfongensis]
MKWIYSFGIGLIQILLPVLAIFFSKMRLFWEGRKDLFQRLLNFRSQNPGKLIWFHVASLGEYEQAKPVIALLKSTYPDSLIVVSFFSPSGYVPATKKAQEHVDYVCYLPLDSAHNAKKMLDILSPQLVFFVKYDLWYHYLKEIKTRNIPLYLIAASFRPDQIYFRRPGFFRDMIFRFDQIFTSNQKTRDLLQGIQYSAHSLAGDTRFDRVQQNAMHRKSFPQIQTWAGQEPVIVLGSVWQEDMDLLIPLIESHAAYKWIIAPHDIRSPHLREWSEQLSQKSIFYSQWDQLEDSRVLLIDNIGMLSSLYQFAQVAYVGGAFGEGLHNILEPLGFGVPVIFGKVKKASKFPEADEAVQRQCGFSVSDEKELNQVFERLMKGENHQNAVKHAHEWVNSQVGAAQRILDFVKEKHPEL